MTRSTGTSRDASPSVTRLHNRCTKKVPGPQPSTRLDRGSAGKRDRLLVPDTETSRIRQHHRADRDLRIVGGDAVSAVLRPHQVGLVDKIDAAIADGRRRIVAQAPTGFGKTIVAAALTARAIDQGPHVIFTVPALSLIDQTVEKFYAEGVRDVGVIQANHVLTNYARPIQVASVQTLQRRDIPAADLVIIDEVHRWFDFYDEVAERPGMGRRPVHRPDGDAVDARVSASTSTR